MAKVKAKLSFAGIVTMGAGETREIIDAAIIKDLVSAGYVEEIGKTSTTPKAPAKRKKGDANEDQ